MSMEFYVAISYDDNCNLVQYDFGNPQVFEQGLYELRKRGIKFEAFLIKLDEQDRLKLLPWS